MVRHLIPTEQRGRAREHDTDRYVSESSFRRPPEDYKMTRRPPTKTRPVHQQRDVRDSQNTMLFDESIMVEERIVSTDVRGRSRARAVSPSSAPLKMRSNSPARSRKVQPRSNRSRSLTWKTETESRSAANIMKTFRASKKESATMRKRSNKLHPVKSSHCEIIVKPVKKIPFIPATMFMAQHSLTSKVASRNQSSRHPPTTFSKLQMRNKPKSKAKSLLPARIKKKATKHIPDQKILDHDDLGYRSHILSSSTSTLSMNDHELNAAAKVALDRLIGDSEYKKDKKKTRKTTAAPFPFFNRSCTAGFVVGQSGKGNYVANVAADLPSPDGKSSSLLLSPFLCGPKSNHQQRHDDTATNLPSTNSSQEDEETATAGSSTQLSSLFQNDDILTTNKDSNYRQNTNCMMTSFALLVDPEMTESSLTTSKSGAENRPTLLKSFGADDRDTYDTHQPKHYAATNEPTTKKSAANAVEPVRPLTKNNADDRHLYYKHQPLENSATAAESKNATTNIEPTTKKSRAKVVEPVRRPLTKNSTSVARKNSRRTTTGTFRFRRCDSDPVKVFGWATEDVAVEEQTAAIDSADNQICGPNHHKDSTLQDATNRTSDVTAPPALETDTEEGVTQNTAQARETAFDRFLVGTRHEALEPVTEEKCSKQWKTKSYVDVLSECNDEFEVIDVDDEDDEVCTTNSRWWQPFNKKPKDSLPLVSKPPSMPKQSCPCKHMGHQQPEDTTEISSTGNGNLVVTDQQQQEEVELQKQEPRQTPRSMSVPFKKHQSAQRKIFSLHGPRSFHDDLTAIVQRRSRLRGVRGYRLDADDDDEREQDNDSKGYNIFKGVRASSSTVCNQARPAAPQTQLSAIVEDKSQLDGHVELLTALRLKRPLVDHMHSDLTSECGNTSISTAAHQDPSQSSVL